MLSEILQKKFQLSIRKCDDGWVAFYISAYVDRGESDKITEQLIDVLHDFNIQETKGCINIVIYAYTPMVSYRISSNIMNKISGIGLEFEITVFPCCAD